MTSHIINQPQKANICKRILVVDDEPGITFMLKTKLELEGYEVLCAGHGVEAMDLIAANGLPHLALIDIIMPEMDGLTLSQNIRKFSDLPIIMLTSVEDEDTIVQAIDSFADDYITKPFRPREVIVRIKRVLSRFDPAIHANEAITQIDGRLSLNLAQQLIIVDGKTVDLTPTETKLLHILTMQPGKVLSGEYLQRRLWPEGAVVEEALRVNIFRLRKKLEIDPRNPKYILTLRGEGYCFRANPIH